MKPANDNRPHRPSSPTRQRVQSLPVSGRLDAETGEVFFDVEPASRRAEVRTALRVVSSGGERSAPP